MVSSGNTSPRRLRFGFLRTRCDLTQQQKHRYHSEKNIEHCERDKWHDQTRHRCYCFTRSHYAIDDPRLAAHFCYGPTRLDRDETEWRGSYQHAQEPFRIKPTVIAAALQV